MTDSNMQKFDVVVVGGGPAGLMVAGTAAEQGTSVAIIEKNSSLGKKLLLTGKGRCNITNAEFNKRKLAEHYGKKGKALLSPLSAFAPQDTIKFFEKIGVKTKTERGQRVFPKSDKATEVLDKLVKHLTKQNINIFTNSKVKDFVKTEDGKISHIVTNKGKKIAANSFVVCTGGKAYPKLGSTGDGFEWAEKLGHTIITPKPALTPIEIEEEWTRKTQGLDLKNIKLSAYQNGKKKTERFGEMIFTHFGISGPTVLDISREVGDLLEKGPVTLVLDLKPALTPQEVDKRIQKDFKKFQNKLFRNSLDDLLPQKIIPIIIKMSEINPNKQVNVITKEERAKLVKLFKELKMTVVDILGFEKAIITSGGIELKEIDFKSMRSKIVDNLFFAGEIINLDGPCGGFNLQICWTTGYIAGKNASILK